MQEDTSELYLDSGLSEVDPAGQVLPDEGVGVVRPLEDPLQSLELAAVEGGPVPALLPLLLLLRVHLLVCRGEEKKKKEKVTSGKGSAVLRLHRPTPRQEHENAV